MRRTHIPYTAFNAQLRKEKILRNLPREKHLALDFSTNDYLGFSKHPLLISKAQAAALAFGVGAKASRLVGAQDNINTLENLIAQTKQAQSALIFNSGYQANAAVIASILDATVLGAKPLVFADRLNHASMHAGIQLAKAKQYRYHHLDVEHLQYFLKQHAQSSAPKFIFTESVFGMDGDVAPLEEIIRLAKQYHAMLYVDDAHATGILGKNGFGLTEDFSKDIDIVMGTFSKALGGSGAYIACSKALKRYLINKSQGFIFSTAPSPIQVAVMQGAWELIPSMREKVKTLIDNAHLVKAALHNLGYDTGNASTHIIPVILKTPEKTIKAQALLARKNIRVSAIRTPSVPLNQSRLRIALTTMHTQDDMVSLINAFEAISDELNA